MFQSGPDTAVHNTVPDPDDHASDQCGIRGIMYPKLNVLCRVEQFLFHRLFLCGVSSIADVT